MKRMLAPNFWHVAKKKTTFVVNAKSGPHPKKKSIPLAVVIRDILGYAKNLREVKIILSNGLVKVDGKIRKSYSHSVGIMDVLSIGDEYFRILPGIKGLYLKKISKKDADIKLFEIKNKTYLKGGKLQINMHGGMNIIIEKNDYSVGDVLVYNLDKKLIEGVLKFGKGSVVVVTDGRNKGNIGKIDDVIVSKGMQSNNVVISVGKDKKTIPENYVFVIGSDKPVIEIGE